MTINAVHFVNIQRNTLDNSLKYKDAKHLKTCRWRFKALVRKGDGE